MSLAGQVDSDLIFLIGGEAVDIVENVAGRTFGRLACERTA